MSKIISLSGVSVKFDRKIVLDDVNFSVEEGDFVAVSGPNGGGKTTLMRVALKLLKPTSGSVEYFTDSRKVKRLRIGYLPQKSNIDLRFPVSVRSAVLSGLIRGCFGKLPPDACEQYERVAALCGIGDLPDQPIGSLSGGQLQRALLARAVISNPEVLVLDEPLSYIDKQFESRFYDLIEELSKSTTLLLVSHEMSVISELANRHLSVNHRITEY